MGLSETKNGHMKIYIKFSYLYHITVFNKLDIMYILQFFNSLNWKRLVHKIKYACLQIKCSSEPHPRVYCFFYIYFFTFVLRCYNGKCFKCATFIKIFSSQMGDAKIIHSLNQQALLNVGYRCYGFYSMSNIHVNLII